MEGGRGGFTSAVLRASFIGSEGWGTFGSVIVGVSGGISSVRIVRVAPRSASWVSSGEPCEETVLRDFGVGIVRGGGRKTRRVKHTSNIHATPVIISGTPADHHTLIDHGWKELPGQMMRVVPQDLQRLAHPSNVS